MRTAGQLRRAASAKVNDIKPITFISVFLVSRVGGTLILTTRDCSEFFARCISFTKQGTISSNGKNMQFSGVMLHVPVSLDLNPHEETFSLTTKHTSQAQINDRLHDGH